MMSTLQELGMTAIWLDGHSLSDPKHFFNVWTPYAATDPDKIDPSLGTPEQFKSLIDEAHRRGIKVFVEVVTHGVTPNSTLVKKHPEWFRGSSWAMIDYDWNGGKPKTYTAQQLASLVLVVKRDRTPRGGIGLIKIESHRKLDEQFVQE